jgi:hypothetical protein
MDRSLREPGTCVSGSFCAGLGMAIGLLHGLRVGNQPQGTIDGGIKKRVLL